MIRFWLSTGIDGMVLDAVNWYAGIDWQKSADFLTNPLRGQFSQPEGGGAFHSDDPVGWITEGNYSNLFDYGLGIWWEPANHLLEQAVRDENPDLLEQALRSYHDRVVAAGGSLYFPVPEMKDAELQTFAEALLVGSGDMLCYCSASDKVLRPAAGIANLLRFKSTHAALFQNSTRRRIHTSEDRHSYAILREAADHSERLLVVFNFLNSQAEVQVDAGAIRAQRFVDAVTHSNAALRTGKITVDLPAHSYRIYEVLRRRFLTTSSLPIF